MSKQSNNKRIIKKLIKKISDIKVMLQINSSLSDIFSDKGVNVIDRRGFYKRHFNKMTLQLLKSLDLDPLKLRAYIIADKCEDLDSNFLSELCMFSNQICICMDNDDNIDSMCEELYNKLGASVTKASPDDLSNKNGVYFLYTADINIVKKLKKTSADKLIFTYNDFNEYSTKNKTIIDGVHFELSRVIMEKIPHNIDSAALVSAMDEECMLDIADFSLKYFTSCNLEVSGGRLVKMKLLDS